MPSANATSRADHPYNKQVLEWLLDNHTTEP